MSERIHVLAQQLFGKPSVAACDLQEIRSLVQRYPYFAPAQFLLLEKLKQENSPEYIHQLQKAVLYYHNPLEFEYFISSDKFLSGPEESQSAIADEETTVPTQLNGLPLQDITEEKAPEFIADPVTPEAGTWGVHLDEAKEEKTEQNEPLDLLEKKLRQIKEQTPFDESKVQDRSGLRSLKEQFSQPVSSDAPAFEPYHTVDYFASQGIKLSQEESGKDKFGKQLKSFTEWLKTMKRLPVSQPSGQTESTNEKKVQHMAEDSVHESDVVTEAMAEVWLKQGNTGKAIELYHKLSLLNPSRMAYFAAKIDHLKRP
jgi:hypothetical protein